MASPQTENGHTKIANELLEQLVKTAILGSEFQIVLFVIRKTYGYQKKEDRISLTQFEKWTGLSRATVNKGLKNLVLRNILVKTAIPTYKFNKDWETWVVKPVKLVKHIDPTGIDRLTKTGIDRYTHKRKKESNTKEIAVAHATADINPIISIFEKSINPTINYGNTTQRKAIETLISKVGLEKTIAAAKYAISIQAEKYAPVITTPTQLLNKYGELQGYYAKQKKSIKQGKTLIL